MKDKINGKIMCKTSKEIIKVILESFEEKGDTIKHMTVKLKKGEQFEALFTGINKNTPGYCHIQFYDTVNEEYINININEIDYISNNLSPQIKRG